MRCHLNRIQRPARCKEKEISGSLSRSEKVSRCQYSCQLAGELVFGECEHCLAPTLSLAGPRLLPVTHSTFASEARVMVSASNECPPFRSTSAPRYVQISSSLAYPVASNRNSGGTNGTTFWRSTTKRHLKVVGLTGPSLSLP